MFLKLSHGSIIWLRVIDAVDAWFRHWERGARDWRGVSMCSNATPLLVCSCNKSPTSTASRLFDALRRRVPGNERLHLIRRKWKRNHAQKTPVGGSRAFVIQWASDGRSVDYSVVWLERLGDTAPCSQIDVLWSPLLRCLIVTLHASRL